MDNFTTPVFVVFGFGGWTDPASTDSDAMNEIGTEDFRKKCFLFYF